MIAEYLEHALQFERMAVDAAEGPLKESLTNQALAYRKLAEERATRLRLHLPKAAAPIARPNCPRCGTRMMLGRIRPAHGKPDHDERTFECPNCGNEISEVVKSK